MFDKVFSEGREAALVARIASLESEKSAAAAEQAVLTAELDRVRRAAEAAAGVPAAKRSKGLASEIALARRDSPNRGGRHLGFAKALVYEMPHTLAALKAGALSEWRATLIVRESACLDLTDRRLLDAGMCADQNALMARATSGSKPTPRPSPTHSIRAPSSTARCAPNPNAPSGSVRHRMRCRM
jgi:hypothetical protein